MTIPHRVSGHRGIGVLLIAALMSASQPTILRGQQKSTQTPDATTRHIESFEERLKALEQRRERQLALGLADETARTSQEIAQLRQRQQQRCAELWSLIEESQRPLPQEAARRGFFGARLPKELKERQERAQELQKDPTIFYECGTAPGTARPNDPTRPNAVLDFDELSIVRRQIESQEAYTRTPLFVQAVLLTTTDADVPNPMIEGINAIAASAANGGIDSPLQQRMKLLNDASRYGRDVDRLTALLETALGQETTPSGKGWVLEMLWQSAQLTGNTSAALRYSEAQLNVLQTAHGADSPRLCYPLWRSIPLLLDNGQPDRALAAAERCVGLSAAKGAKSLTYASAMSNLGLVYHRTGSVARAIESYETALATLDQVPVGLGAQGLEATQQPAHLNVRANLGLAYWQQGDLARASSYFQAARARMTMEGQNAVSERNTIASLAKLQAEVDALVSLERQLTQDSNAPLLALPLVLERKGMALDDKAATVKRFAKDPGVLREYRSLLAYRARLARGTPIRPDDLSETGRQMGEAEFQMQSLEYTARMDELTGADTYFSPPTPQQTDYAKYWMEVGKETQKLMAAYSKRRPKDDRRAETEVMMQLQAEAQAKVAPKFKGVLEAQQASTRGVREELLPRVQARLPESAVLLEMLRYRPMNVTAATDAERWQPARYGAFVVKHTGRPAFVDFGGGEEIDSLIAEFRRTLSQPRGTLAHDLGRRLNDVLMQPVRPLLGGANTLYLSPDGALNLLPFAALVDEQDRYLLEVFTLNYVSTGRDLTRTAAQAGTPSTAPVVLGDPAFDGIVDQRAAPAGEVTTRGLRDQTFDRLPETAVESRTVADLLRTATVLTGTEATETALKSVESPRVLHVATHGFFLADQDLSTATLPGGTITLEDPMLRSGIVLAGANVGKSGNDDGVLTALEAAGLNLVGTQLVVLSACETGVGEVRTGEGVFGLRRAFMVAGAETLVMSLWQVEDTATQRLMTGFYQRLTQGQDRTQALRQASLAMMKDPSYRHPFFWASFIAVGEAGPLHR